MTDRPQNPHRCSDNGCVLLVQSRSSGMGTNGGCNCIPRPGRVWDAEDRTRVRLGLRWLTQELARMDKEGT